jgi:hypothetical protein
MRQEGAKYVTDLRAWELPRLEDLAQRVVDELLSSPPRALDRMRLEEDLYDRLLPRLRDLAQTTINETIEYWMKGLADGLDGEHPEFCVELSYLERADDVDPLTVVYAVDNQDGTRTELLRTTIAAALNRVIGDDIIRSDMERRVRVMAAELRALAERLEGSAPRMS